jgi:hypothetical protein
MQQTAVEATKLSGHAQVETVGAKRGGKLFRPAHATDGLVEVNTVVSAAGSLLTVVNWRMQPTNVTVHVDNSTGWLPSFSTATIGSSGRALRVQRLGKPEGIVLETFIPGLVLSQ